MSEAGSSARVRDSRFAPGRSTTSTSKRGSTTCRPSGPLLNIALRTYYSRDTQDGLYQEDGGRSFFRLTRVPGIVDVLRRDTLNRLFIRPNLQGGGSQNENPLYYLENVVRSDVANRF